MGKGQQGGGKKGRKTGRDLEKCARYRSRGTRLINKVRKLEKHLVLNPQDANAKKALNETKEQLI